MKIGNLDIEKMYLGSDADVKVYLGDVKVYPSEEPTPVPFEEQYLTFVAEADNMSVGLSYANSNVYQYSTDSGATWNNLANNESTSSVNSGETIIFKASGLSIDTNNGIGILTPSVISSVQGNVMSLVFGDNFSEQTIISAAHQLRRLFYNCTNITSAENLILPATTLASYCYASMFEGCTSLTTAPELPSTTLKSGCYYHMYKGCTGLTTVPVLSATTISVRSYQEMFNGCGSLNYIKCLATDISASNCTAFWVEGVAPSGTFVKAASMSSWATGANGIPNGWTIQNDDGSPVGDNWDDQE